MEKREIDSNKRVLRCGGTGRTPASKNFFILCKPAVRYDSNSCVFMHFEKAESFSFPVCFSWEDLGFVYSEG